MPPPHQSSHSSCDCLDAAGRVLLPFPMAEVPIELFSRARWSAKLEKSSQNACLLSSTVETPLYPLALGPSTKRLKPSCALFAPACADLATLLAATLAWAAKSESEI